jgi:hypothetical protein
MGRRNAHCIDTRTHSQLPEFMATVHETASSFRSHFITSTNLTDFIESLKEEEALCCQKPKIRHDGRTPSRALQLQTKRTYIRQPRIEIRKLNLHNHKLKMCMAAAHCQLQKQPAAVSTCLERPTCSPEGTLDRGVKCKKTKLRGLSPRANYTDRATAASRRS